MATKNDFSSDEWKQLLQSVMISGMAVTAADPGGLWGTLKEGTASARALAAARNSSNGLINEVVEAFGTSDGRTMARDGLRDKFSKSSSGDITAGAIESLRDVASLLELKAPGDAGEFKGWLYDISVKVAEASKEGGFLGFGGVRVSDAEKATLDDISVALGV